MKELNGNSSWIGSKDKDGVIQLSKTLSGPPPEKKEQLFPSLIRRIRGI